MDHAGACYYDLHRKLFKLMGCWPYYTTPKLAIWRTLIACMFLISLLDQIFYFVVAKVPYATFVKDMLPFSISLTFAIKYIGHWVQLNGTKNLLDRVSQDWQMLTNRDELAILIKCTALGRYQSVLLALMLYPAATCVILLPWVSTILDIVTPLNETRAHLYLFVSAYSYQDEHFHQYLITHTVIVFFGVSSIVFVESFTIMSLQHNSALFRITSFRLRCILCKESREDIKATSKVDAHFALRDVFALHQRAVEFAKCWENIISMSFFIVLLIAVGALTLSLFRLSQAIDFDEFTFCTLFIGTNLSIVFFLHYIMHQLDDYSREIFTATYDSKWYEVPVSQQKLLLLPLQKAMHGVTFSLGGMYNPSLENFAMCIKASWSYFMVIYSYQT